MGQSAHGARVFSLEGLNAGPPPMGQSAHGAPLPTTAALASLAPPAPATARWGPCGSRSRCRARWPPFLLEGLNAGPPPMGQSANGAPLSTTAGRALRALRRRPQRRGAGGPAARARAVALAGRPGGMEVARFAVARFGFAFASLSLASASRSLRFRLLRLRVRFAVARFGFRLSASLRCRSLRLSAFGFASLSLASSLAFALLSLASPSAYTLGRTRTCTLLIRNQALIHSSYEGRKCREGVAPSLVGLQPAMLARASARSGRRGGREVSPCGRWFAANLMYSRRHSTMIEAGDDPTTSGVSGRRSAC